MRASVLMSHKSFNNCYVGCLFQVHISFVINRSLVCVAECSLDTNVLAYQLDTLAGAMLKARDTAVITTRHVRRVNVIRLIADRWVICDEQSLRRLLYSWHAPIPGRHFNFFQGGGQYICWDIRECLYHVGMHAHTHACVQYCAPYNRSMNYVFTLKHPQNISNKMYRNLQSKEKIAHFIIEIVNNLNVTKNAWDFENFAWEMG